MAVLTTASIPYCAVETLTPFFSNSLAIFGKLRLGTFLMLRIIKRLCCGLSISGLPLHGRIFTDFMFPYLSMMKWMVDRGRPKHSIFLTMTISIFNISQADCEV